MIARHGKLRNGLVVFSSVGPATRDLLAGVWRGPDRKRWLVPLAVFLSLTALLLLLAASVEALAPFIYSIF